jgi:hypothetical protein
MASRQASSTKRVNLPAEQTSGASWRLLISAAREVRIRRPVDEQFVALQERLNNPNFKVKDEDESTPDRHVRFSHTDKEKSQRSTTVRQSLSNFTKLTDNVVQVEKDVVTATESNEVGHVMKTKDDEHHEHSSGGDIPKKPCRVITVSHLSPNVAKLLRSKFKISADFFNRHLPGTGAISGRLISHLPSAVQIDLDELYESHNTFEDIWNTNDPL